MPGRFERFCVAVKHGELVFATHPRFQRSTAARVERNKSRHWREAERAARSYAERDRHTAAALTREIRNTRRRGPLGKHPGLVASHERDLRDLAKRKAACIRSAERWEARAADIAASGLK
jgi:hypothetical protein